MSVKRDHFALCHFLLGDADAAFHDLARYLGFGGVLMKTGGAGRHGRLAYACLFLFLLGSTNSLAAQDAAAGTAAGRIPFDPGRPPSATIDLSAASAAMPPEIPTSVLAGVPALSGFRVSPDGMHLLARNEVDGMTRLAVLDVAGKADPFVIGVPDKWELAWYRWAVPNRVLASVSTIVPWEGDEARQTRLIVCDLRSRKIQFIGKPEEGLRGDDLTYVDPSGDWILLTVQRTIYDYPSVLRFDLSNNKSKEVVREKDDVWNWFADNSGVVRMGLGFQGKTYRVYYRQKDGDDFRVVARPKVDDDNAIFDVFRIYQGSDDGYVLSNEKTGRYALYKFNLATRELGEKIYDNPTNDIDDFDTVDDGAGLLYASYTDDRYRIHWFDPVFDDLQKGIDGGLKGRQNWMTSWARDKSVIMVWTGDSDDPGRYYLFVPNEGKMVRYYVPYPDLKPATLAASQYVIYKVRDGLDIPAYLTLPKGRPAEGLPLVILPHGGPYEVRDDRSFDTQVQLLANRGYAVLQPNYRGSGGYGKDFSDKGFGQWGRAMQDDLDDGMDWLVKQGIVDPKRVCIVGASYGGYAALWGAIRNPERYRCAASFAGVTDLGRQLKYDNDFFIAKKYQKDWRDRIRGATDFDMNSVSPVYQAAQVKVPLLITHGEDDTNVPFKQAKAFVDALQKAGKSFEFHSYEDEGHGFDKVADEQDWLDRLEAFLTKYNPA
jgi:dipeptidyl aminopeptidase/acylaminoacyl peptidase